MWNRLLLHVIGMQFHNGNAIWYISRQFLSRFMHLFWLRIATFIRFRQLAHGGWHRSTGDAYPSWPKDPTCGKSRCPCLPCTRFCILYFLKIDYVLLSFESLFIVIFVLFFREKKRNSNFYDNLPVWHLGNSFQGWNVNVLLL